MVEDLDGTYDLGPSSGRLLVETGRTGLGSRAGHDLTIEVTRWRGTTVIDTADPGACSVSLDADVDSLRVREGTGGIKPLTGSDRAEIERILREKSLNAPKHPTITFRSTRVEGTATSFTVTGDLAVAGATRPITIRGSLAGGRVRGSATVVQSKWGIKPYSAFFGALQLADEVTVELDIALPPNATGAGDR